MGKNVKLGRNQKGKNIKMEINPISPISTKSLIERDNFTSEIKQSKA